MNKQQRLVKLEDKQKRKESGGYWGMCLASLYGDTNAPARVWHDRVLTIGELYKLELGAKNEPT